MFDLEAICSEVEKLDPITFAQLIGEKGESVIAGIAGITGDGDDAITLFTALVLSVAISDSKLDEKEYTLIKPLLEEAVGEEISYDEAIEFMSAFKSQRGDYNKLTEALSSLFSVASDELKSDIVLLCLLICATDGKISKREKNWLQKLIG